MRLINIIDKIIINMILNFTKDKDKFFLNIRQLKKQNK